MAEVIAVQENKAEAVPHASLMENLENIGQGLKDTWQGATAALTETGHSVQNAVGKALESVEGVVEGAAESLGGAVRGSTRALGWVFDFPAHLRRHPWLMMGGAVLLGVCMGRLVGGRRR